MPSTVIADMHYDEVSRSLTIVYRGERGTYRYFGVSSEEYAEFRAAPSKGIYLNQVFKARLHPYQRVGTSHIFYPSASEPSWQEPLQKSLLRALKTSE